MLIELNKDRMIFNIELCIRKKSHQSRPLTKKKFKERKG